VTYAQRLAWLRQRIYEQDEKLRLENVKLNRPVVAASVAVLRALGLA
jgi:hypothetical protein